MRSVRIAPLELRQRRDQHGGSEERQRTDPEFGVGLAAMAQYVVAGVLQRRQRSRDFCEITLTIGRQPYRTRAAHEQLGAELLFQPADLMADRGRTERQVARRAAKAELRRGALERQQGGQGWDRAQRRERGF